MGEKRRSLFSEKSIIFQKEVILNYRNVCLLFDLFCSEGFSIINPHVGLETVCASLLCLLIFTFLAPAAGLQELCVLYISALPLESFLAAPMSSV